MALGNENIIALSEETVGFLIRVQLDGNSGGGF